jgi:hypothetical protein
VTASTGESFQNSVCFSSSFFLFAPLKLLAVVLSFLSRLSKKWGIGVVLSGPQRFELFKSIKELVWEVGNCIVLYHHQKIIMKKYINFF